MSDQCCPKCGSERLERSKVFAVDYACGSLNWLLTDKEIPRFVQSDRCRIAELERQLAEARSAKVATVVPPPITAREEFNALRESLRMWMMEAGRLREVLNRMERG